VCVEELEYEDELEGADKLTFWGLAPPRYKVVFRFKGGKEISLYLGNEVPQRKGLIYTLLPAEQKTYTIGDSFLDIVKKYLLEQ
jgi:hypothetical protein